MKNRFSQKKNPSNRRNFLISVCFFAVIACSFCLGISSVSAKSDEEALSTLEQAVMRSVTYCYAMEGSYPSSLLYLKENYGLFYDEEKFYIDYLPLGANIMPEITIIRRTEQ